MIKVENGVCHIKTSKGIPGLTTDLAVIVRTVKKILMEGCDHSETEAKKVIDRAVELGLATDEEVTQEAMVAMGKVMILLKKSTTLEEDVYLKGA